ncbi:MAG: acyltransferase, partial [Akkermansia sp.]
MATQKARPAPPRNSAYFPHIDGIRTLAIIPVLLYHLCSTLCPGGYAGVDVFFVISGYLITGGILRDLKNNQFSLVNFYHRRVKRIIPAYSVLILFVIATGIVLFNEEQLKTLAITSNYSSYFSTNLYFWRYSGYFSPQAHDNPLLNLWSLGVEEQFYIILP